MSTVVFNSENSQEQLKKIEKFFDELPRFMKNFLLLQGLDCLDQTKRLTPVNTGQLRNNWELSDVRRISGGYEIQIFNTTQWASFIEDGHRQQVGRFVPGVIVNGRFEFRRGVRSGIVLRKPFINGFHMCRISLENIDDQMQQKFEIAVQKFRSRHGL